jgi:hypothetical protein
MTFTGLDDKGRRPVRVPYEPACARCGHPKRSHINMLGRSVSLGSFLCTGYREPHLPAGATIAEVDELLLEAKATPDPHTHKPNEANIKMLEGLRAKIISLVEGAKAGAAEGAKEAEKNAESANAAAEVQNANEAAAHQPKLINIGSAPKEEEK